MYSQPQVGKSAESAAAANLGFFSTFDGSALLKDLATGNGVYYTYKQGVRQLSPVARADKSVKPTTNERTMSCFVVVNCTWSGECRASNTIYGTITSGVDYCYEPDPNNGMCQYDVLWTRTSTWTTTYCDGNGNGGSDPGSGPTDPGCTTCSGPVTPPTNLNSPCGRMYTLGNQQLFRDANSNLLSIIGRNGEFGYAYRNNGQNGNDYEFRESNYASNATDDERLRIQWNQLAWPLDGLMHTHPAGSYSVFSMSDLQAIYRLKRSNQMVNPDAFTMIVLIAGGDEYALKISNLNDFEDFGGQIYTDDGLQGFEDTWIINEPGKYNISETNVASTNEQALLRLLKERKTGLTMFKLDRASNSWSQLGLNAANQPINIPCL